jgi:hypothetical protein
VAFAHARPFLYAMGDTILAWMLLRRAVVESAKLTDKPKKKDVVPGGLEGPCGRVYHEQSADQPVIGTVSSGSCGSYLADRMLWPSYRGGILRCADKWKLKNVYATLAGLEKQYGARFKPADLIK